MSGFGQTHHAAGLQLSQKTFQSGERALEPLGDIGRAAGSAKGFEKRNDFGGV